MKPNFEWDDEKSKRNRSKHRVGFDEAVSIFDDPRLITFSDPLHSESEDRYLSIGVSSRGRILIVAHTEREDKIRIISCRKAIGLERKRYEENQE